MNIYVDANLMYVASTFCMDIGAKIPRTAILPASRTGTRTLAEAEVEAVLWALTMAPADIALDIYTHSQDTVKKLKQEWKTKPEGRLLLLLQKVWSRSEGRQVRFHWIPKKQNLAVGILKSTC
mgnify:CR=1 FL=1|tara:strand:+ start:4066 stop:4434 length:369 start_codon:yes stop_codon:yes gene_type:complete